MAGRIFASTTVRDGILGWDADIPSLHTDHAAIITYCVYKLYVRISFIAFMVYRMCVCGMRIIVQRCCINYIPRIRFVTRCCYSKVHTWRE